MTRLPPAIPVAALVALAAAAWPGARDEFPWLTDLDAARALAAEEGKPLLVVFR